MPILKPNIDSNGIEPKSERKIYKQLKNMDPLKTKDWIIYYSYYFKRRDSLYSSYGTYINQNNEIDFLILAPNVGIFVLEVKGGNIKVEDGNIFTINRLGKSSLIDPYEQGKRNFYSLRDILIKNIKLDQFIYSTLVSFPDISNIPNVGNKSNKVDTIVQNMDMYPFIMKNANYIKTIEPSKIAPSLEDVKKISKLLEGENFVYSKNKADYIQSINLSINNLTEEQMTVFNGLLENDRCLINGKAGTGKTVLCQFLYNYYSIEKKKSVIYFTFNKLIAESIGSNVMKDNSSCCYPIFDYLESEYCRLTKNDIPNFENFEKKRDFLFSNVGKLISDHIDARKYDCLIIDEAQDIIDSDDAFLFFDNLLNNGLDNGNCYIFYDSKQNIFTERKDMFYERNEFDLYRYAKFKLNRNCRNGYNIDKATNILLENQINDVSKLSNYDKSDDILFFNIYQDKNGALVIANEIDKLISEGIKYKQITVLFNLSTSNQKNVIFKELKNIYGNKFEEFSLENKHLTYSTTSKFKGMENDIIIYVNDNSITRSNVHYVAISRAKVLAYIFKIK